MVQWLSSDIYIFEPVLFSEGFESLSFYFLFVSFSYSFSGQFEFQTVVDPEEVQVVRKRLFHFYRDIQEK